MSASECSNANPDESMLPRCVDDAGSRDVGVISSWNSLDHRGWIQANAIAKPQRTEHFAATAQVHQRSHTVSPSQYHGGCSALHCRALDARKREDRVNEIEHWRANVDSAISTGDRARLTQLLAAPTSVEQLHELLDGLTVGQLRNLMRVIGDDHAAQLLSRLDAIEASLVLNRLPAADAADILESMSPDDAADLIAEIAPDDAVDIMIEMEPVEAEELRELLQYPPDTAGGRMTPHFVAIDPELRADQATRALRHLAERAETINYVYVTDDDGRLIGVLSLRRLVLSPSAAFVRDLMASRLISVPANAHQEEAARLLVEHNLYAVPVVDEQQRLLGIITADDVADILEQEATEDFERLGGSQPLDIPYLRATVPLLVRRRVGWLLLLFVAEAYTGTVLRAFEDELQAVVALTFFIPLLIGTGGNVGSQTTTTLVRAIAIGEVNLRDVARILRKEISVGLILGAVMAVVAFGRAEILGVPMSVSFVVALTIAAITLWAAMVASVLPLILRRLGIDPAVVSAPLITTLVDGTGLVIYFTIAKILLDL